MDEWIQLVLFLIFGTIALLSRVFSRRGSKEEPDVLPEEEEITLPPWGNVPMEEEGFPHPEFVEEETPTAPPAPAPQVASEPPPEKEETPGSAASCDTDDCGHPSDASNLSTRDHSC